MLPLQGSTFQEEGVTTWVGFPPGEWVDEPFPPSQTGDSSGERGGGASVDTSEGRRLFSKVPATQWSMGTRTVPLGYAALFKKLT